MSVKTNVLIAGGAAGFLGLLKAVTQGVHIPGWLTLLVWLPVIVVLGFAGYSFYETIKTQEAKRLKRQQKTQEAAEQRRVSEELR